MAVTWEQLCDLARELPGVVVDPARIVVADAPFVRRLDATTVMFALAESDDRDKVIASAPEVLFIQPKYAALPVVLAHLERVNAAMARDCVRHAWRVSAPPDIIAMKTKKARAKLKKAAPPQPSPATSTVEKETGPNIYYLGFHTAEGGRERRNFRRIGRGRVAEWLVRSWHAHRDHLTWGDKLPVDAHRMITHMFDLAAKTVDIPEVAEGNEDILLDHLFCEKNIMHLGSEQRAREASDDTWEATIFDEEYLASDEADYLPHPDRGDSKKLADDPYRVFLRKHAKHLRTTKSRIR